VESTERLMATACIFPDLAQRVHSMIPTFIVSTEHYSGASAGIRSSLLVFSVRMLGSKLRSACAGIWPVEKLAFSVMLARFLGFSLDDTLVLPFFLFDSAVIGGRSHAPPWS
jgi:hypothetical protein